MPPRRQPGRPSRTRSLLLAGAVGLLALIAAPRRPLSAEEAHRQSTAHLLRLARGELAGAIRDYRCDHGMWPGFEPEGPLDRPAGGGWLESQLTRPTDARGRAGASGAPGFPFGPYLPGLPANPLNGRSDVRVLRRGEPPAPEPDGRSGWIFDPATGALRSNARWPSSARQDA